MLKIGYVRLRDLDSAMDTADLKAMGCHVVRAEEPAAPGAREDAVLSSILEFIGEGDELVVTQLWHLSSDSRGLLSVLDRLEDRGACLYVRDAHLSNLGAEGRALRAALEAVSRLEPARQLDRRRPAKVQDIRALRHAGVGPVEIARRLGVSRMTVWRKLKAVEAQA